MATLIDTLLVSLKLDGGDFKRDANDATKANKDLADSTKKATAESDKFAKSINNGVKALAGLFSAILVSTGMQKLIDDTAKANDQLNFLSKNLGMSATAVKRWQGAAEMSGGSADGMAASLSGLSKSLWDMVTMGDTSVLPYFNALNVGVIKSNGELRNLDDILLDVSDSLSKMSRPQAYNFAKNMGFDDGTINMLLQGRREVEEYLALQKDIVVSSEQELEISRQLNKQNALVSRQWEGLKALLANYLMPYALKFSETISGFLNYLNRNRDTAVFVFKAIGAVIGLTLIPLALKAGAAFMGMFAPLFGGVGLLLLLGGAIAALYDDYDKWKKGEKSLFDWSEWDASITFVLEKLKAFKEWFQDTTIGKWFTDQDGNLNGWKLALGGFATWFAGKWALKILSTLTKIGAGFFRMFGLPGLLVGGAVLAFGILANKIDEVFDSLEKFNDKMIEKFGNVAVAVNKINDPNATIEEKAMAAAKAVDGFGVAPGAGLLSLGMEGAGNVFGNLKQALFGGVAGAPSLGNSRGERNNNPLNMNYVGQNNSVLEGGKGARFAKFNTPYDGLSATVSQLLRYYDGKTTGKKLQTVEDIIKTWAPSSDNNNTSGYIKSVADDLGVSPSQTLDLRDPDVMKALMHSMSKVEIGKSLPYSDSLIMAAINGTGDPTVNAINNSKGIMASLSNPISSGVGGLADNFLGQTQKLQSQPQTVNNKTDINVGDINVMTTASTVSGVSGDAIDSIANRVYQIVPTLN
ncbi:hypothetical protein [Providencia rettgeri]|uniref:hypothetical protein n=1 Tax=Providencia rettgeri TaxID=587 RepID=UPI0029152937|nr:hypothetical protein [Providencia rettgeri]EMA4647331.1 hypothetical protein [Providencia rettgeri]WRR98693.1 hypothetical protein VNI59_08110 [Providencia rettgeri]